MSKLNPKEQVGACPEPDALALRLGLIRLSVGIFAFIFLLARAPGFYQTASSRAARFVPVGLPEWLGQTQAVAPSVAMAVYLLSVLSCIAFLLGVYFRWLAPIFAFSLLWVTSYKSSFGMIFHTENLLSLQVLLLAFAPAAARVSLDARRARRSRLGAGAAVGVAPQVVLFALSLLTVGAYFVAGVAKWKLSGMDWVSGDTLRVQIAYDNLRKLELGSIYSPIGAWSVQFAWLFPPLGFLTMLAELGGPLALLHRRLTQIWVVLVVGFHWGVLLLMAIAFAYPLAGIPFFWAFQIERTRVGRWAARLLESA